MISWFSRSGSVGVASEAELRFHLKKEKRGDSDSSDFWHDEETKVF